MNGMSAIGRVSRAVLLALGGLAVAPAWAADDSSPWLLGVQLGQARGTAKVDSIASVQRGADPSTMSYDMAASVGGSNRFGWRVFTGYRVGDYFAIHVGYTDLGEAQSRLVDDASTLDLMPRFERVGVQTVRGVDAGVQLKVPVSERISVDVHGGRYFWDSRTRISGSWSEGYRTDSSSTRRDSSDFFGAGLEVNVINDLSATLSWTRYEVGSEPVALWTLGALYRFGLY